MRVTFVKTGARRYDVHAERERAPGLRLRAPGYDDYLPHDRVATAGRAKAAAGAAEAATAGDGTALKRDA